MPLDSSALTRVSSGDPAWLARARSEAFELFQSLGMPAAGDELWKYVDLDFDLDEFTLAPVPRSAPGGYSDQTPGLAVVDGIGLGPGFASEGFLLEPLAAAFGRDGAGGRPLRRRRHRPRQVLRRRSGVRRRRGVHRGLSPPSRRGADPRRSLGDRGRVGFFPESDDLARGRSRVLGGRRHDLRRRSERRGGTRDRRRRGRCRQPQADHPPEVGRRHHLDSQSPGYRRPRCRRDRRRGGSRRGPVAGASRRGPRRSWLVGAHRGRLLRRSRPRCSTTATSCGTRARTPTRRCS